MLRSAWSAYHETLLYVRELTEQSPSGLHADPTSSAAHDAPVSPSSSPAAARAPLVKAVDSALLRCWLCAVFSVPAATASATSSREDAAAVASWTRILASWIALRTEAVRATGAATDVADVQEELRTYQRLFVPVAWPHLSPAMRERLPVLLQRCALPKHHEEPAAPVEAHGASSSSVAAVREEAEAVCTCAAEARQRVARDQMRIGWDALRPAGVPDTVCERLKGLSKSRPERVDTVDSCETGPHVAVVHSLCLKNLLPSLRRLCRVRQQPEVDAAAASGVGVAPWLATTHDALLHVGYDLLTKAHASQVERCYHILPALMDFEACVRLCAPDEAAGADSAPSGTAATAATSGTGPARTYRLLCATLEALLQAAFHLYRGAITTLLADYGKRSIADAPAPHMVAGNASALPSINPLLPAPPAAVLQSTSDVRRLSAPAFAVLVEAVEPTCDLLHRYPADWNTAVSCDAADGHHKASLQDSHSCARSLDPAGNVLTRSSRDGAAPRRGVRGVPDVQRALMTFLAAELGACFDHARGAPGVVAKLGTKADKVRAQAAQDAYLCTLYLAVYGPPARESGR